MSRLSYTAGAMPETLMAVLEVNPRSSRNGDAASTLTVIVSDHLDTLPLDARLSTTALMKALGATFEQFSALTSHLYNARATGLLEGYYSRGKKGAGTFGHASIIWHNRDKSLDEITEG